MHTVLLFGEPVKSQTMTTTKPYNCNHKTSFAALKVRCSQIKTVPATICWFIICLLGKHYLILLRFIVIYPLNFICFLLSNDWFNNSKRKTPPWRIRNLKYHEMKIEEWPSRAKWGQVGQNRAKLCVDIFFNLP